MRNERGYITTNLTKLKRIIREYYEQPSEMNMLQKKHKEKKKIQKIWIYLQQRNWITNLNFLQKKKIPDPNVSIENFIKHLRNLYLFFTNYSREDGEGRERNTSKLILRPLLLITKSDKNIMKKRKCLQMQNSHQNIANWNQLHIKISYIP